MRVRVMKCDHAVQLCMCCICGVLFTTSPSIGWRLTKQPKPALIQRKIVTNRQGKLFASWLDPDEVVCFPATLLELPTCFRVNRVAVFIVCPQIVVHFAVSFVGEEFCILLGLLPNACRAIVCILELEWLLRSS